MERKNSTFNSLLNVFILHAEQKDKVNSIEDSNKKKVLIGGGTGFIGTELCKSLKRKGYLPVIVSRNSGDSKITYEELGKKGIPKNTKAIVNLAGENVLNFFKRWDVIFKGEVCKIVFTYPHES